LRFPPCQRVPAVACPPALRQAPPECNGSSPHTATAEPAMRRPAAHPKLPLLPSPWRPNQGFVPRGRKDQSPARSAAGEPGHAGRSRCGSLECGRSEAARHRPPRRRWPLVRPPFMFDPASRFSDFTDGKRRPEAFLPHGARGVPVAAKPERVRAHQSSGPEKPMTEIKSTRASTLPASWSEISSFV